MIISVQINQKHISNYSSTYSLSIQKVSHNQTQIPAAIKPILLVLALDHISLTSNLLQHDQYIQ